MRQILLGFVILAAAISCTAQKPIIFDVSNVVVGPQKIQTLYLFAEGKWSDAGDHVGPDSTQIHCYQSLGFCEVASADWNGEEAVVNLTAFDILRWDNNELIAVNSSPVCVVNTLRADFLTKRMTLGSSDKGVASNPFCKGSDKLPTAVLWGMEDYVKDKINRTKAKK